MATLPHTSPGTWPQPATVEELGATALSSCVAAAGRYATLAKEMERHGQNELAAVFEQLVIEQKALERAILSQGVLPREGATHADASAWAGLEDVSDRDEEAQNPHLSTPYKARAFAVRNAERAFRFYSYIAATAASNAMRNLAEWLATEELAEAEQQRVRRRRAYHARRAGGDAAPPPNPRQINSLANLLAAAMVVERRVSRHIAGAMAAGADLLSLADQMRRHVDDLARARNACSDPGPPAAWETAPLTEVGTPEKVGDAKTRSREIRLALTESERAFAFYNTVVSTTSNETVMLEAQRLSQNILQVISTLSTYKA